MQLSVQGCTKALCKVTEKERLEMQRQLAGIPQVLPMGGGGSAPTLARVRAGKQSRPLCQRRLVLCDTCSKREVRDHFHLCFKMASRACPPHTHALRPPGYSRRAKMSPGRCTDAKKDPARSVPTARRERYDPAVRAFPYRFPARPPPCLYIGTCGPEEEERLQKGPLQGGMRAPPPSTPASYPTALAFTGCRSGGWGGCRGGG